MKMGKIVAIMVLMVMVLSVPMMAMADTEPNDDFSSAEVIGEGEHTGTVSDYYDDNFEEHEDVDYYKVTVPAGKAILVSAYANATNSVSIDMYDSERADAGFVYAEDGSLDRDLYDGKSSTPYDVYLKVSTYDDMVSYTMNIEFRPSDLRSYATEINEGQTVSDTLYDTLESHWYKINIPAHKALKLTCTASGDDIYISLYKEDGTIISMDDGTSFVVEAKNNGDSSEIAYIKIETITMNNKVTYTLNPTFEDNSEAGSTSPSVSDDSPALGAPLLIIGVLGVAAVVGIRRRKA